MQEHVSLELSKKLIELGAPKEAEKWWVTNSQPAGQIMTDNMLLVLAKDRGAKFPMYPAFSCCQCLEWLFQAISRLGMSKNAVWDDSAVCVCPGYFKAEIPDNFAKMLIHLLQNGWEFKDGVLCKEK